MNFAVLQIAILAVLATIGMTLRQLPDFAFRTAGDFATELAKLHERYDPLLGAGLVETFARLGFFSVFRSPWFLASLAILLVSIVVCTLDRLPRLWRGARDVRVVQPDPFFDPLLPDRAGMDGVPDDGLRTALRRRRFAVREAETDGVRYLYGDRHRYTKLATLLTHLGLVLFLTAAAVTAAFGKEAGLIVAEGESTTVQSIGTEGLLSIKNLGFEAPGLETGTPMDFTTDLAVYQGGREIARKTVRVNDPLSVGGFTLHENGFGPAPDIVVSDRDGRPLWSGPVPLTSTAAGLPYGQLSVPGRDVGLELLFRGADGILVVLPFRVTGRNPDGSPSVEELFPMAIAIGEAQTNPTIDFSVGFRRPADYTVIIAKADPGQGLVWLAFISLISGLLITFYLPRRRVWARLATDGRLAIVWRSDRYVDVEREFGALLDDLVAVRQSAG